uniref:Uncharacterized protein n=1 Tax=Hyaloperonospora arabidopsidis (strain Emoy2) TaxID=559515 RepID=M4BPZ9_HYAAE
MDAFLKLDVALLNNSLVKPRLPHSEPTSLSKPQSSRRLPPDVRRARHRDRMQRQRLLEKKSIELKRLEVESLSQELTRVTTSLFKELPGDTWSLEDLESTSCCFKKEDHELELESEELWNMDPSVAARVVQHRYVHLVLQQGTIAEENRRLTERFREWQRFMKLIAVEEERLQPTKAIALEDKLEKEREQVVAGQWLTFIHGEPVLFYQPISRNACHELMFMGYQQMQEISRGPGARDLYNEAFGWKVCFSMHQDHSERGDGVRKAQMQHRFFKKISAIDANGERVTSDTLAQVTWKIISTPELYSQMYRTPLTSKILQRVDARTRVLMRTFPDEDAVMSMRFVCLVAEVHDCVIIDSSDTIDATLEGNTRRRVTIMSSLFDPNKVFPYIDTHVPDATFEWMQDGLSYLSFTEFDDEEMIEIEYGGLMHVRRETASCTGLPFAAMNIGEALVRWEQFVTPMRTLLLSDK